MAIAAHNSVVVPMQVSGAYTTLIADSNPHRKGLLVFNAHDKIVYLKLGYDASSTSYTTQIPKYSLFELPAWGESTYTGPISARAEDSTGIVLVTEVGLGT